MPPGSPVKYDHHGVGVNPAEREVIMGQHSGSNDSQSGPAVPVGSVGGAVDSSTPAILATLETPAAEESATITLGAPSSYYYDQSTTSSAQPAENPANPVLFVDDHVSPGMCWLGAEVQVENKIARRCSYEEMVHEDTEDVLVPTSSDRSHHGSDDIWYQAVLRMTQWALTLQEVYDERSRSNIINSKKCLCHKASAIGQKLAHLTNVLLHQDASDSQPDQFDLMKTVDDVQSALRAGVSIQISKPHEAVIGKTVSVVDAAMASCDKTAYVRSAVESIVKLVDVLLNVPTCGHANNSGLLDDSDRIRDVSPTRLMEQDEEEDIRSRVASMFQDSGNSDEEDDDTDDEDNMETGSGTPRVARKRKQLLESGGAGSGYSSSNNRNNLSTSPTSSPSKRARKIKSPLPTISGSVYHTPMSTSGCSSSSALGSLMPMSAPAKINCQTTSPALDLLETKKKVQRNSLYHWVLWREALRGEKDRTKEPNQPQSPRPTRLSFSTEIHSTDI